MQREYGMRSRAVDGEIGPRDKLLFIEGERKKRLYLSFHCLLHTVCYLDLLSGECIRSVTRGWRDSGWRDGGGGHKGERTWDWMLSATVPIRSLIIRDKGRVAEKASASGDSSGWVNIVEVRFRVVWFVSSGIRSLTHPDLLPWCCRLQSNLRNGRRRMRDGLFCISWPPEVKVTSYDTSSRVQLPARLW